MARIAYPSPMPPARTGIATYSAQVLVSLKEIGFQKRHRVQVLWPLDPRVDETVASADLAVYHVGNNAEFHAEIYRLAVRNPGLVVLHDLAIDDLVGWFRDTGDPLGLRAAGEAEPARRNLYETRPDIQGPLETPWCAHLLRRARGVVVHSIFGAEYIAAIGSRTPTFVVPHPVISPPRAARKAAKRGREIRQEHGDSFLIGVLGDIGGSKGIDAVLGAVSRLDGEVRVAIVGRRIPGYDVESAVAASRIAEDRVTVAVDVSERDFYAWLEAVDVVVNLRHPHRGEVSGTLVRAMAAGKPVIVQAAGTYLDYSADAVVRIPAGDPDPSALADALRTLQNPDVRERIGSRAREEMERLRSEQATAHGYEHAIDATLELLGNPVRWATARWASALAASAPAGGDVDLAVPHVERLRELADVPTGVEWAGSSGRYG